MSMRQALWFFDTRFGDEDQDFDVETSIPPIVPGDTAAPVALPVTVGDKITIYYPDDLDADIRVRENVEVWHYGGADADTVKLLTEEQHEEAMSAGSSFYNPRYVSSTREGVYTFNNRVIKHADKVEVEHIDVQHL